MDDPARLAEIASANELHQPKLSEEQVEQLLAFLRALTDPAMLDLRVEVPDEVPSGLPLAD
jgi:cytochrome c peroxidase